MSKKLVANWAVIVFCIAAVFAGGQKDAPKQIVLKYAHVGIAGEIQTRYVDELAAMVEEKTGGAVKIQVFPNSQLGGANEMVDGIKSGAIDMGHHDFAQLTKFYEPIGVFNAPYIYRDAKHALAATNPATSAVLREVNDELVKVAGIRVLGSNYRGARNLSTTNIKVLTPNDLKGVKIRGTPNALWMSMITGMGAIPTPVDISELYTALLTGVVSGQENPITNIYTQKFHEVQKYIMLTEHMQAILCTFINEKSWQKISPENQKIISDCMQVMAQKTLEYVNQDEAPVIKAMKDYGVQFVGEAEGLRNDLFRASVNAQIKKDFPSWAKYIDAIQKM